MSTSEVFVYDEDWDDSDDETVEDYERRSKPRNRKKYVELRRRAEERLAKKRLKEQLGYYDYDDIDSLEI